ncbi:MAG: Flp pilus assembly complex ATPase component TadA [Armatimonadetes bacterium]|nr:Flp pilus assembly complex ATPase component TadA [Armatimonadota bacterium]
MTETEARPSLEEVVEFLRRTQLFQTLDRDQLEAIAGVTRVMVYGPGETIVKQGEQGNEFFMIAAGSVDVLVEDPNLGIEQPLVQLAKFMSFGEMSLLLGMPRAATIRSREGAVCVTLAKLDFEAIIQAVPQVGLATSRYLASRLYSQSQLTGFAFVRLADRTLDPEVYSILPHQLLVQYQAVPLEVSGDTLTVALTRPTDPSVLAALRTGLPGMKLHPVACSLDDYQEALQKVIEPRLARSRRPTQGIPAEQVRLIEPVEGPRSPAADISEIDRLLREVLGEALGREATAVHFEPWPDRMSVRIRTDGRLEEIRGLSRELSADLSRRLEQLGWLPPSERLRPRKGSARFRVGTEYYDLRIRTLPSQHGEKLLLLLQDPSRLTIALPALMPAEHTAAVVRATLVSPGGLTVVTGPPGSGKTVTLYTLIQERLRAVPDQSLVTVENPVELTLQGVVQSEVRESEGLAFADLARAAQLQEPDVLALGDLPGPETALVAVETALAGRTVLATFRAEDTVAAISGLQQLELPPYQLASALQMIVCQRLLRRICSKCRTPHEYGPAVRQNLDRVGILPLGDTIGLYRGRGCSACGETGQQGVVPAFEVLVVQEMVRDMLAEGRAGRSIRSAAAEAKSLANFKHYAGFLLRMGYIVPTEALRYFALS